MIYSILVMASASKGPTSNTAATFARAVLARGHTIHRVFFLGDGVDIGLANAVFPQDETQALSGWTALVDEYNVELVLCVSSALRRGVLGDAEAAHHQGASNTLHRAFTISGLGQLVEASAHSDRLVTFGA